MRLSRPFIRLPFVFAADALAEEMRALLAEAWLAHPSGLIGNSAIPLISRDGGDNNDFSGRMAPTPHLDHCPYHRQVMASFGEVLARSRLMRIEPGCEVPPHVDFNYHWRSRVRIHVPVVTAPEVRFHCGESRVHMEAGSCWIFDSWRRHRVINGSQQDRVHLVIDLAGSSRFWRRVRAELAAPSEPVFLPPDPRAEVALMTERYNQSPVMAPGEVDGLVAELVADFSAASSNDPHLVRRYQELLEDFAQDWRELWQQHGPEPAGRPHYRGLIERTMRSLHPDRRALVTASNGIGVNPVIVQRILRAALVSDEVGSDVDRTQDG